MEIDCPICGNRVKMPEWLQTEDFEGHLPCTGCRTLWGVVFKKNKLEYFHPSGLTMAEDWGIPSVFADSFEPLAA